jgi:ATP-binding cassette subfamily B protein
LLALIKKKSLFSKTFNYYISDPALGRITYSEDEFIRNWISTTQNNDEKGVVLLLEPGPKFYEIAESGKTKHSFSFLFSYFLKYKALFFQLILGPVLGGELAP